MCGNEVLHVAAQRNCFERWERPAFFRKKVCIAIVSYLIFIKNSALAFAIYLLLLEMLLKSKKKKNTEVDIRKKRGKNKNGKYACKNVMH